MQEDLEVYLTTQQWKNKNAKTTLNIFATRRVVFLFFFLSCRHHLCLVSAYFTNPSLLEMKFCKSLRSLIPVIILRCTLLNFWSKPVYIYNVYIRWHTVHILSIFKTTRAYINLISLSVYGCN